MIGIWMSFPKEIGKKSSKDLKQDQGDVSGPSVKPSTFTDTLEMIQRKSDCEEVVHGGMLIGDNQSYVVMNLKI